MGNTKKRIKNCKKNAKKGAAALRNKKRLLESAYGDTSGKRMREADEKFSCIYEFMALINKSEILMNNITVLNYSNSVIVEEVSDVLYSVIDTLEIQEEREDEDVVEVVATVNNNKTPQLIAPVRLRIKSMTKILKVIHIKLDVFDFGHVITQSTKLCCPVKQGNMSKPTK